MLSTLRIKNLALVMDLTWELQPGLNIISGETGAGKSILIGALNLVLGERADRTLIRSGSESCTVEAVFQVRGLQPRLDGYLEENGLERCEGDALMLKRTFTAAGANRQFINGSPASLQVLARIGEWLVDIHGPHEHQSLLHPSRQLDILDAFGGLGPARTAFAALVDRQSALMAEKAALVVDEKTYAQQLDLLRFQSAEISAAKLQAGEEIELEQNYRRASSAARLLELTQTGLGMLSENESNLLDQAGGLGRILQDLQKLDSSTDALLALHATALGNLQELQQDLSRYADRLELDPGQLQALEERLNLVQGLKRKYGASVAEVIAFGEEAQRKLHALEQRDTELTRINTELSRVAKKIWQAGQELSTQRRKLIPALSKAVRKQLRQLGFAQSEFDTALTTPTCAEACPAHLARTGLDSMEFQFAPNPGEPARPLRAIASSGELARVMLALKTVLAAVDQIPVLVFDEVDANIGGETATAVGERMRQIAAQRQVLCITHLPQVAAQATSHYLVNKQVKAGRTTSELRLLEAEERVDEIARMLGGQSGAARQHAVALLSAGDRTP